ncbi:hypothetical protein GF325_15375 [Candidatus Bathyarchaeota archaeon]|nr:hypothetical protein [Candidatus Bathyarchaeota archaeon]
MPNETYTFVVVGLGHISDNWLPSFQDQSKMFGDERRVDIIAFVDPDKSTWSKPEKYGFGDRPCYQRLEDVWKDDEADATLILTPPQYHLRYIWESVYECTNILTEKPFVTNNNQLKQVRGLFDLIKEQELLCVVNQQYRWAERITAIRKAIDDGEIGDLGFVVSYFNEPDYHFNRWWRQLHEDISAFNWFVHHYDTMRYILHNRKPVEVYGKLIRLPYSKIVGESTAFLNVTFEDDIEWVYTGSQEGRGYKTPGQSMFTIHGSKGMIENPRDGPPILHDINGEEHILGPDLGDAHAPYPDYWHVTLKKFVESLDAGEPVDEDLTTFEDNQWTIVIPLCARESSRFGHKINVESFLESL